MIVTYTAAEFRDLKQRDGIDFDRATGVVWLEPDEHGHERCVDALACRMSDAGSEDDVRVFTAARGADALAELEAHRLR